MAKSTGFYIKGMTLDMKKFSEYSKNQLAAACDKAGVQLLDWMANGSPNVAEQPPIRWGILSASGSVFVQNKFIAATDGTNMRAVSTRGSETPTPNKQLGSSGGSPDKIKITVGFNTEYAAKVHETKLNPGPYSLQAGPHRYPGNQWVMRHIDGDKESMMQIIAAFLKAKL